MFSYEWDKWRTYAGLAYILRHDPDDLESGAAQVGVEFRYPVRFVGAHQFLGGLDVEMFEQVDWDASTSLKAGLAFGNQSRGGHGIRLLAEFYNRPAPFGQFFSIDVTYYGAGIYYDF